jgi:tetratricopeptide (TPR) repeat protein
VTAKRRAPPPSLGAAPAGLLASHPYLWIVLLGALVYAQTLFFKFNFLDDNQMILGHQAILRRLSSIFLAFREDAFFSPEKFYYRPLLTVSFILDAQWGGAAPFAYRLTNLLLHLLSSCLVFRFLERLRAPRSGAAFLALAFALHPAAVHAVALISARNDTLLAIFVLSSFLAFIEYVEFGRKGYGFLHIAFWLMALFTKETAVALPLLCGLYLSWIRSETWLLPRPRPLVWAWAGLGLAWFLLRGKVLDNPHAFAIGDMTSAVVHQSPVIISYLGKLVFPFDLPLFPVLTQMRLGAGGAALALGAFLFARSRRQDRPLIAFGAAWYLLFLVPPLLLPAGFGSQNTFMNHRVYVPAIGALMAFGLPLLREASAWRPSARRALGAALLAFYGVMTLRLSRDFKDRLTFWEAAVRSSPDSAFARNNLGAMQFLDGRQDLALEQWKRAVALNPFERLAHGNIGLVDMRRGDLPEAEAEFKTELSLNPNYDDARFNLGVLYYREGKAGRAAELWKETLVINPYYTDAYETLLAVALNTRDAVLSARYLRQAQGLGIVLPKNLTDAANNLVASEKK